MNNFSESYALILQGFLTPFLKKNLTNRSKFAVKPNDYIIFQSAGAISLSMMVFLSIKWTYIYITLDIRLPNTGQNTATKSPARNTAALVNIPALRQNMEVLYKSYS